MAESVEDRRTLQDRLLDSPGWIFHLLAIVGVLGVLWSASAPLAAPVPTGPLAWLGLGVATVWAVRTVVATARRRLSFPYLAVPALALLAGVLIFADLPQQIRWQQAQGGFEETLRSLPTPKKWEQATVDAVTPDRIGSYAIDAISRGPAGHVRFDVGGGVAITYLVDGITDEVRQASPAARFEQIRGNWFSVRAGG